MENGIVIDVSDEDVDFIDFFNDLFDGFEEVSESEDEEYLDFDDEWGRVIKKEC